MRPFVTLNMVQSLDGVTRDASGRSVGLGSRVDRLVMDFLRAEACLVACGAATVRADDPWLHLRTPEAQAHRRAQHPTAPPHPLAAIFLQRGTLMPSARCFSVPDGLEPASLPPLWLVRAVAADATPPDNDTPHTGSKGRVTESLRIAPGVAGLVDFAERAYKRGVEHIVLEGGRTLAALFVAAELIDEIFVTIAPRYLGGEPNRGGIEPQHLKLLEHAQLGDEIFLRYRVEKKGRTPRPRLASTWLAERTRDATQIFAYKKYSS